MRLHKEEEAICRRLNDLAGLQASLGNQALILEDIGDLDGAMRLYKEVEAICRRINDPQGLHRTLGNQALMLADTGDFDGAMRLHKEEEAICRRLNDLAGLQASLGNQALSLQATGDLDGAIRLQMEEEAVCRQLNELVRKLPTFIRPEALVYQVNQVLRGWANYFCYGTYTPAFHAVHQHVCRRVRRWLRRKFELRGQGCSQYPESDLEREFGLLNIQKLPRRYSWAKP